MSAATGTGRGPGKQAGDGRAATPPDNRRRDSRDPRAAARQRRAAEARAAAEAKERRRRRLLVLASVLGILILAAVVGIVVQSSRQHSKPVVVPSAATGTDNGIVVGSATAPVTVDFYEDFQCPVCGQFEKTTGSTVTSLINSGKIKAVYHMMSFLGPDSVRAANAGAAAADAGKFKQFHDVLYANQPRENTGGFGTDRLVQLGAQAGLTSSDFTSAVRDGKFDGFVSKVEDDASKRGVTGTPTIMIDGRTLDQSQWLPDTFTAAVNAAH
jgi:protein-disulfide isomerase